MHINSGKVEKFLKLLLKVKSGDEYSLRLFERMRLMMRNLSNYKLTVKKIFGNEQVINLHIIYNHSALLLHDLNDAVATLDNASLSINKKINLLRTSSIIYKNIYDFIKSPKVASVFKCDKFAFLKKRREQLIKKLKIFELLRNFAGGHINPKLLLQSAQWASHILRTDFDLDEQVYWVNLSILECLFNRHINTTERPIFNSEIDMRIDGSKIFDYWIDSAETDFSIKR